MCSTRLLPAPPLTSPYLFTCCAPLLRSSRPLHIPCPRSSPGPLRHLPPLFDTSSPLSPCYILGAARPAELWHPPDGPSGSSRLPQTTLASTASGASAPTPQTASTPSSSCPLWGVPERFCQGEPPPPLVRSGERQGAVPTEGSRRLLPAGGFCRMSPMRLGWSLGSGRYFHLGPHLPTRRCLPAPHPIPETLHLLQHAFCFLPPPPLPPISPPPKPRLSPHLSSGRSRAHRRRLHCAGHPHQRPHLQDGELHGDPPPATFPPPCGPLMNPFFQPPVVSRTLRTATGEKGASGVQRSLAARISKLGSST